MGTWRGKTKQGKRKATRSKRKNENEKKGENGKQGREKIKRKEQKRGRKRRKERGKKGEKKTARTPLGRCRAPRVLPRRFLIFSFFLFPPAVGWIQVCRDSNDRAIILRKRLSIAGRESRRRRKEQSRTLCPGLVNGDPIED